MALCFYNGEKFGLAELHLQPMKQLSAAVALFASVLLLLRYDAVAWNIPGHMLSGAIAYQILQREIHRQFQRFGLFWRKIRGTKCGGSTATEAAGY